MLGLVGLGLRLHDAHSNRAECNNLNDVHLWERYIVLIKSVSVIVYCGVHEWLLRAWLNCCVNFHQVEEFLGTIASLMKFSPVLEYKSA